MASNSSSSSGAPPASQDAAAPVPAIENATTNVVEPTSLEIVVPPAQPAPVEPNQAVAAPIEDYSDDGGDDVDEPTEGAAPGQELTEDQKYAREVRQKWRNMIATELRETMAKPAGAAELVRCASQMQEEQLQIIAPYMTDAQIASSIPSLQLQQQNALVLGFTATQVRQAVRAIPGGDRQLLLQNITLITASETDPSKDEEVQGIIGFIDPLAMAVAVERPELVDKVIRASCIMTPDQIRVMVPLVPLNQVRTMIETIVSAESHDIVMQMLLPEQRQELVTQCQNDLAEVESSMRKVSADVTAWADTKLPELSRLVHGFCNKPLTSLATNEHATLASRLLTAKTQLERCHRETRNMQKKIKLPLTVLQKDLVPKEEQKKTKKAEASSTSAAEVVKSAEVEKEVAKSDKPAPEVALLKSFLHVQEELAKLGKTVSAQYAILDNTGDNHGLIHKLYDTWSKFQAEQGPVTAPAAEDSHEGNSMSKEEQMYVDYDLSTALYYAVQAIGNPNTIGDIYKFTWNDIIDLGFRSADDFNAKGVTNLKQLESLIHKHKGIKSPSGSPEVAPAAEQ